MNFYGLQKVTLLDYPGKIASTVFVGGCNLRCPFCHNGTLVSSPATYKPIPEAEIFAILKQRTKVLDGICVTGGEPLLYDIAPFLTKVKELGLRVKLDHNGTAPRELQSLISQQLVDYVAIDIKNSPDKYASTVGIDTFDITPVLQTIQLLLHSDVDYEFRTTVVKELHTAADFHEIGAMIAGAKRYFLQQFINSGDILHNTSFHACSYEEMQTFANIAKLYVSDVQIRGT